jgi:hypothetical protein
MSINLEGGSGEFVKFVSRIIHLSISLNTLSYLLFFYEKLDHLLPAFLSTYEIFDTLSLEYLLLLCSRGSLSRFKLNMH